MANEEEGKKRKKTDETESDPDLRSTVTSSASPVKDKGKGSK